MTNEAKLGVKRGDQLADKGGVQRVQDLRPVEAHHGVSVLDLDQGAGRTHAGMRLERPFVFGLDHPRGGVADCERGRVEVGSQGLGLQESGRLRSGRDDDLEG